MLFLILAGLVGAIVGSGLVYGLIMVALCTASFRR